MDSKTALKYAEDHGAKFLSLRFTDLIGAWHHLTFPIHELDAGKFEDGFGFDASSLRGWASIHESDMLLIPDAGRMWMDPFAGEETLCLIANAVDPMTEEGYGLDPRSVARRAESYLRFTGIGPTSLTSAPRPSSSSSTRPASTTNRIQPATRSNPTRATGRAGARATTCAAPISATAFALRRVTCPSLRRTP